MLHYISRSVCVVVNCIVRVSQSKIPLIIDVAISITTALCTSQRIRFPLKQRYPLEIDLDASCYHAMVNAKDTRTGTHTGTCNVNLFSQNFKHSKQFQI